MASADLIVEAITENLPLKQKLFAEWDKVGRDYISSSHPPLQACPEKTLLATNTSFLRVGDIMKVLNILYFRVCKDFHPSGCVPLGQVRRAALLQPGPCDEAAGGGQVGLEWFLFTPNVPTAGSLRPLTTPLRPCQPGARPSGSTPSAARTLPASLSTGSLDLTSRSVGFILLQISLHLAV